MNIPRRDGAAVSALYADGATEWANGFFLLGLSVLELGVTLLGIGMSLVPIVSGRPRRSRRWTSRRSRARIAAVGAARTTAERRLPADALVDVDARRRRVATRAHLLLYPSVAVISLGFLCAEYGSLWHLFDTQENSGNRFPEMRWVGASTGVFGLYFACCCGAMFFRRWLYRQHPDLFAVHHLLAAIELLLKVRGDRPVDMLTTRRQIAGELGEAARYLERLIGKVLSRDMRGAERDDATRRAKELAAAVRRHQVTAVGGSRETFAQMGDVLEGILIAFVEDRFADLPRALAGGPGTVPADHIYAGPAPPPTHGMETGGGGTADPTEPDGGDVPVLTDIVLSASDRALFRRELARTYTTSAAADSVLTAVGYGRERRPNIDALRPDIAWNEIFSDLDSGVVASPYRNLLAAVLADRPGNHVFVDLSGRYGVGIPRAGVASPGTGTGTGAGTARRSPVERTRIFLCCADADRSKTVALYGKLRADGYSPWLDVEDVVGGQSRDLETRRAIRSSRFVVACLSASSVSRPGQLHRDLRLALDTADEQPEGAIYLIPARIDDVDLPDRLSHLLPVDLFAGDGYDRLLRALRQAP